MSIYEQVLTSLEHGATIDQAARDAGCPADLARTMADHASRTGRIHIAHALPSTTPGSQPSCGPSCPAASSHQTLATWACSTCPLARLIA